MTFTHQVADGMHGAIVKAVRSTAVPSAPLPTEASAPCVGCC